MREKKYELSCNVLAAFFIKTKQPRSKYHSMHYKASSVARSP